MNSMRERLGQAIWRGALLSAVVVTACGGKSDEDDQQNTSWLRRYEQHRRQERDRRLGGQQLHVRRIRGQLHIGRSRRHGGQRRRQPSAPSLR